MPSYTIFSKKHNGGGCCIFHFWRTFYCLQSQGIVKYQALLVSPKLSFLVALMWKIRTLLCPVTFFLKSTTVEGVEFSIVKDVLLSTVTGYSEVLLVSPKFSYLVALLWKIRTLLCPVTRFFLKSTTVEGVVFSIVLKDFLLSTVTGYSEVPSPAGFSII